MASAVGRARRSRRSSDGIVAPTADGQGSSRVDVRGARGRGAGRGPPGLGRRAAPVPQRRHARLHQGRLQHGQVPRLGLGQGRVPALALRLRPRRGPLPPDPRGRRPADRPGRARRLPAPEQGDRQGRPHRRQANRARQRGLPDRPALARGRRARRPGRGTPSRSGSRSSRAGPSSPRPPRPSGSSSGPATPTGPTATSPGSPSSSATTTPPSAVDDQGLATGKGPGEAFILARFDKFTAGVPIIVRPGTPFRSPGDPGRSIRSTRSSTPSSTGSTSCRRRSAPTRRSSAGRTST